MLIVTGFPCSGLRLVTEISKEFGFVCKDQLDKNLEELAKHSHGEHKKWVCCDSTLCLTHEEYDFPMKYVICVRNPMVTIDRMCSHINIAQMELVEMSYKVTRTDFDSLTNPTELFAGWLKHYTSILKVSNTHRMIINFENLFRGGYVTDMELYKLSIFSDTDVMPSQWSNIAEKVIDPARRTILNYEPNAWYSYINKSLADRITEVYEQLCLEANREIF